VAARLATEAVRRAARSGGKAHDAVAGQLEGLDRVEADILGCH